MSSITFWPVLKMALEILLCTPHMNSENGAQGSTLARWVPLETEISLSRSGISPHNATHRREARGGWSQSWRLRQRGMEWCPRQGVFPHSGSRTRTLADRVDYLVNMNLFRIKWGFAKMPLENSESGKGDDSPPNQGYIGVSLWDTS